MAPLEEGGNPFFVPPPRCGEGEKGNPFFVPPPRCGEGEKGNPFFVPPPRCGEGEKRSQLLPPRGSDLLFLFCLAPPLRFGEGVGGWGCFNAERGGAS
jgi:hypothetical protein